MKEEKVGASFVNEEQMRYERKQTTYTQRYDHLMKLIRLDKLMKSAKIIKPGH